jgi:glycosyltransferase involved in cell wall biosynthesis
MDKLKKIFVNHGQRLLVVCVYYFSLLLVKIRNRNLPLQQWVIGTDEVAGVLGRLGEIFPNSKVVCFTPIRNSSETYTFSILPGRFSYLKRLLLGPILFGYYSAQRRNFFYVWNTGFILNREFEMNFLKRHGCRIVVMCCGDEIRSIRKQRTLARLAGRDSFVNYEPYVMREDLLDKYELSREVWAQTLTSKVDVVFNAPNCQSSYLPDAAENVYHSHGFFFARQVAVHPLELEVGQKAKIVHAPSSLNTKGTMLVRAAIHSLQKNRNDFEYIELVNEPHHKVMTALQTSHICLNQFLSFGTGIFGLEAMAAGNAVLMSADPNQEPSILPWVEGRPAWLVTQSWEIEKNLNLLLDDENLRRSISREGLSYVRSHYSMDSAAKRIIEPLRTSGLIG